MRRFATHILIYSLPLLLILLGLELGIRNIPNNYSYKNNFITKKGNKINTLILGNSHAFYGINPNDISDSTFNLASVSQTLFFDQLLLKNHIDHLPNLKHIILNISYHSIFTDSLIEENWRLKNYSIYYKLNYKEKTLKSEFEIPNQSSKLLLQTLNNYYRKGYNQIYCTKEGYGINFGSSNEKELLSMLQTRIDRHTHKPPFVYKNANLRHLNSIIQLAKNNNVTVTLMTLPVHPIYRKKMDDFQINNMYQEINLLTQKHPHVVYHNFLDTTLPNKYFTDIDHLNSFGSQKIISILKK